jgi:hypothetical protein
VRFDVLALFYAGSLDTRLLDPRLFDTRLLDTRPLHSVFFPPRLGTRFIAEHTRLW